MTSQTSQPETRILGRTMLSAVLLTALACSIALSASGCEKKKKKVAPPAPPPPAPVYVPPPPVDVGAVIQQLQADARVQFPAEQAPADRTLAEGIVKLADRLAKGDSKGMKALLTPPAQNIVDELVSTGGWADATKNIEQVRVVTVSGASDERPTSSLVGLAIQGKDGAYLLAWNGVRSGDSWVFQHAYSQGDVKTRASDFDGVSIAGGFDLSSLKGDAAPVEEGAAAAPKPTEAPAEPARDPRRKNTPAGPINIPGGSPRLR